MLPQLTVKLSEQQITKVFMLYYGQKYTFQKDTEWYSHIPLDMSLKSFRENMLRPYNCRLELKHLFDITDAEVYELCKLVAPQEFGEYRFSKWEIKSSKSNESFKQQNINVTNPKSNYQFEFDLIDGGINMYILNGGLDSIPLVECQEYKQWYFAHGYAVPLYPWGENAFKLGLAIDFRAQERAKGLVPSLLELGEIQRFTQHEQADLKRSVDITQLKAGLKLRPIFDKNGKICNGYDSAKDFAEKNLKDQDYTIFHYEIDDWTTDIEFEELRGKRFNSVHFRVSE